MSLQQAAKHLERHGRNGDDMLVHMSRGEVKSLNDIAMAHGGQLTINPQTGLPEAGFLKSLLPMIAGAGLMAVSGGAINPMTAGLLVGGGTGLMTGDIKKGLVAGLGAYGGAGMASGLAASGTQAAAVNPSVTPPVSASACCASSHQERMRKPLLHQRPIQIPHRLQTLRSQLLPRQYANKPRQLGR
jgi:hypothetical protein